MDWNRDGKVDGHDAVHFHEVINSDSAPDFGSNTGGRSYGSNRSNNKQVATPKIQICPLAKIVLGITVFLTLGMLANGSGEAVGTTLGLGAVAFLIAQTVDG